MQKKVVKIDLAIYQDIQGIAKRINYKSDIVGGISRLRSLANDDLKYWQSLKSDAEVVKSDFVKKAQEIGVDVRGTENLQVIDKVISESEKYEMKMKNLQRAVNDLLSMLSQ